MRVTRLYTGNDGHSHFDEVELPTEKAGAGVDVTALPGTRGVFLRTLDESSNPASEQFHGAQRRQYAITLSGSMEIWLKDGSRRTFGPGDILMSEEESQGEGHAARTFNGPRITIYIPIEKESVP